MRHMYMHACTHTLTLIYTGIKTFSHPFKMTELIKSFYAIT